MAGDARRRRVAKKREKRRSFYNHSIHAASFLGAWARRHWWTVPLGGGVGELFKIGSSRSTRNARRSATWQNRILVPTGSYDFGFIFCFRSDMCPFKINSTEERNRPRPQ